MLYAIYHYDVMFVQRGKVQHLSTSQSCADMLRYNCKACERDLAYCNLQISSGQF